MTLLSINGSAPPASTTIVYRPTGGIEGYREVHDGVTDMVVSSFAWATMREVPIVAVPACYLLVDHNSVYLGETVDIKRRLNEHARDSSKNFAREVYLITAAHRLSELWSDSTTAEFLQCELTDLAEQAALVEVVKGANPRIPGLSNDRRAMLEPLVRHCQRLLFDAGCRVFRSNAPTQRRAAADAESLGSDPAGPMRIGVNATPIPGSELELAYGDLWVRGFPHEGRFVVMAGSEVRSSVNESAWDWVKDDRHQLRAAGALLPIAGLEDRERLGVAIEFGSASSAAKLVTGSRDGGKWVPLRSQPTQTIV
jgi:hypothetical protein